MKKHKINKVILSASDAKDIADGLSLVIGAYAPDMTEEEMDRLYDVGKVFKQISEKPSNFEVHWKLGEVIE